MASSETTPRARVSATRSLPTELVDIILTELFASCSYVKAYALVCALVCKHWNARANLALYHTIQPRSYTSLRRLELTIRRKPLLGGLVRKLVFPQLPFRCKVTPHGVNPISPWATWGLPLAPNQKYIAGLSLHHNPFAELNQDPGKLGLLFSKILLFCKGLEEL